MIAKLFWYRFSPSAVNLIHSNLTNRTQRVKINRSFSRQINIECGILQGSALDPFLFSIDLIHLFHKCEDSNIANYNDDTTQYAYGENKDCYIGITTTSF